jgi:hypothetical protein
MRSITKCSGKSLVKILPLIVIVTFIATLVGPGQAKAATWYNNNWLYRKKITINFPQVSSTQANFPVLVNLTTDSDLAAMAQSNGNDILFTSSDMLTKIPHEIEKYTSATGALSAWVNVPSVSSVANTDIYMYYGNSSAANQQNPTGTWDSNFKMVKHLKEATGGAAAIKDSTLNANDGTDQGSPTLAAAGKMDGAVNFDGITPQYIDQPNTPSLNTTGAITVEAWIYPTAYMDDSGIIAKAEDASGSSYKLTVLSGAASFQVSRNTSGTVWRTATVGSALSLNTWHHIVGVYNMTNVLIYQDGVLTTGNTNNVSIPSTPLTNVTIGDYSDLSADFVFAGTIDEARISSTARSTGWVTTSYNNQNSPATFYTLGPQEYAYATPVISTGLPTSIGTTSANVQYTLSDDGGGACNVTLEWGTGTGVYPSNQVFTGITSPVTNPVSLTPLIPGQEYFYRARAANPLFSANGTEQKFLTQPVEPSGLAVTSSTYSSLTLDWTKGTGANRTLILRKPGSSPANTGDGTVVYFNTGTIYTDTPLTPGVVYYYRAWSEITTDSMQQYSTNSSSTSFTIVTPAVLTTDNATSVTETSAVLNGTLIDDGGGTCQYSFEWGTTSGIYTANISWTGPLTTGDTFSTTLSSLAKGQKYYFRAKVKNSDGTVYGSQLDFLTRPDAPVSFNATGNGPFQIDLTWTPGAGAGRTMVRGKSSGYPTSYTDGYQVYFGPGTSASDSPLSANTTYFYAAWSEKSGSQQWSNTFLTANATTGPPIPTWVGGIVLPVNKAAILVPRIITAIITIFLAARFVLYLRKRSASRKIF